MNGSFASGSNTTVTIWNVDGKVLQTFNHAFRVDQVIELKRGGVIVSAAYSIKMWDVSTGVCLHTLIDFTTRITGLIKLSEEVFLSGSTDKTIRVWDETGCLETIHTSHKITAMSRSGDYIITTSRGLLQIRQLK